MTNYRLVRDLHPVDVVDDLIELVDNGHLQPDHLRDDVQSYVGRFRSPQQAAGYFLASLMPNAQDDQRAATEEVIGRPPTTREVTEHYLDAITANTGTVQMWKMHGGYWAVFDYS